MRCAIRYQVYNLENVKGTHGGVLLLENCNFTISNTLPWVFLTFFKLPKSYQIAQSTTINDEDVIGFFSFFPTRLNLRLEPLTVIIPTP